MKLHSWFRSLLAALSLFVWLSLACQAAEAQFFVAGTLHAFTGGTGDGADTQAGLITDVAGNLYGTTEKGGAHGYGCVFELVNSSGSYTEKILFSFAGGFDGAYPTAGLLMDGSGNLYGTTVSGGSGSGTVFELVNSSGSYSEKILYRFAGASDDGRNPYAGLITDASGNLYGTTESGGANGYGCVFELGNSSGSYTQKILYSFAGGPDGAYPRAGLLMDAAGNLYGTAVDGGANAQGTVFELVNSFGSYSGKVLHAFGGGSDGAFPYAGLIMDGSGNLYGTTSEGGARGNGGAGFGTVFELLDSAGSYSENVLYSFAGGIDGALPHANLIMDGSVNLYGTTGSGGANGDGTIFQLVNSAGSYGENVLYSFTGGGDGASPRAGLIMDSSINLYGTTGSGGPFGAGTVFEVAKANGPVPTTTTLTSSANPAVAGEPVTFTATVTAPPNYYPGGTITLSTPSGSVTLALPLGGSTGLSVAAEALGGIGSYKLTAQYAPSGPEFAASSASLSMTVTEAGVVVTNGNNTLTGTETVNGNVDASAFVGNGSALTNVQAAGVNCTSCIGNPQLAISYAASASQGGPASNALLLGGLLPSAFQPAGSYATTGANSFSGNQSITGNLTVSRNSATAGTTTLGPNGTPIVQHLSMTFTPTFELSAIGCTSQSFTFQGVNDGDTVALGVPNERMTTPDIAYTAWVSTGNTVTIRACAYLTKPNNLGSGAIRLDVWQH